MTGRRTCIGEQLARQELFLFFTNMLHNFAITLPEGQPKPSLEPVNDFVSKPQPYQVCFEYKH